MQQGDGLTILVRRCFRPKINRDKQLYSSANQYLKLIDRSFFFLIGNSNRQIIKGVLGVCEIQHYEKYLGLPSLTGKGKKKVLIISKKEYEENCSKEFSFSSRRLSKPFQLMQWVASN